MGDQPIPDRYGKGWGGLPEPLSEVGAIHPFNAPGYTRQPSKGEQRDPIRGRGGVRSTKTKTTQGGRKYLPPQGELQSVVMGGITQGTVKDPPRSEQYMCLLDLIHNM